MSDPATERHHIIFDLGNQVIQQPDGPVRQFAPPSHPFQFYHRSSPATARLIVQRRCKQHQRRKGPTSPRSASHPVTGRLLPGGRREGIQHDTQVLRPRRSASQHPVEERFRLPIGRRDDQNAGHGPATATRTI